LRNVLLKLINTHKIQIKVLDLEDKKENL